MSLKARYEAKIKDRIATNPTLLAGNGFQGKSICIDITGEGGGAWTFVFDSNEALSVEDGRNEANCTIEMKDETLEGLVKGTVNVPFAVMTRKIKIKGEGSLAAKVGMALQKLLK